MAVAINTTQWSFGPTTAGEILAPQIVTAAGTPTALSSTFTNSSTVGGDSVSNVGAGVHGFRVALPTFDATARRYLQMQMSVDNNTTASSVATQGMRIIFFDTLGNWALYPFSGGELGNNGTSGKETDGYFGTFGQLEGSASNCFTIDPTTTPYEQSATPVDWTQLAGFEINYVLTGSARVQLVVGRLQGIDDYVCTGSTSLVELGEQTGSITPSPDWDFERNFSPPVAYTLGFSVSVYMALVGLQIGDGTTQTTFSATDAGIGWWDIATDPAPTWYHSHITAPRRISFNTSATDSITLADCTFAAKQRFGLRVIGTACGLTMDRVSVIGAYDVAELVHGTYTDCIFDGGAAPVQIGAAASLVDCIIRNAASGVIAAQITGAAGDYSGLVVRLNNPDALADIAAGTGGAGTYDVTGITVPAGYTLKLRNDSATNAVTFEIPAGITFSTTTAGGAITVNVNQAQVLDNAAVNGMVAGSRLRIYNTTTATEVYNDVVVGTSYSLDYTNGTTFSAGDAVEIRIAYANGSSARLPFTALTTATANGFSVTANQEVDSVYEQNAIDGSTVTGLAIDAVNNHIDIDRAGGTLSVQEGYAWFAVAQASATGIVSAWNAFTAIDTLNYRNNASNLFLLHNVNATPLTIDGGFYFRADGANPVFNDPSSNSVYFNSGRAYGVNVGGSALTPTESAQLARIHGLIEDSGGDRFTAKALEAAPSGGSSITVADIEASTVLAKEATVNSRASQASVDAIPTTTLLSSDYIIPDNTSIAQILADTNELQTNQGNWVTSTGFATPSDITSLQSAIQSDIAALDFASTADLINVALKSNQAIINEGVKKASRLIPHSDDTI